MSALKFVFVHVHPFSRSFSSRNAMGFPLPPLRKETINLKIPIISKFIEYKCDEIPQIYTIQKRIKRHKYRRFTSPPWLEGALVIGDPIEVMTWSPMRWPIRRWSMPTRAMATRGGRRKYCDRLSAAGHWLMWCQEFAIIWLVVTGTWLLCFHILGTIIPID